LGERERVRVLGEIRGLKRRARSADLEYYKGGVSVPRWWRGVGVGRTGQNVEDRMLKVKMKKTFDIHF
jgi:hypothetical protein